MENSYRDNIVEFSSIYLGKKFDLTETNNDEFTPSEFTYFIFKQLFNVIKIIFYIIHKSLYRPLVFHLSNQS